jgi:hypothetical protein
VVLRRLLRALFAGLLLQLERRIPTCKLQRPTHLYQYLGSAGRGRSVSIPEQIGDTCLLTRDALLARLDVALGHGKQFFGLQGD